MADRGASGAIRAVVEQDGLDGRVGPKQADEFRSAIARVPDDSDRV